MKYHPILFSTPMVQAIGDGTKKQTRRTKGLEEVNKNPDDWNFAGFGTNPDNEQDKRLYAYFTIKNTETWFYVKCPYQVGDVFWVKETFRAIDQDNGSPRIEYKATEKINLSDKWKPSIFMPKSAARYFLRIKSIKVERLQKISEADAVAEGIDFLAGILSKHYYNYISMKYGCTPNESFQSLWYSINGKESLNSNPFVWVYEFEQIEKPDNFIKADN